jgi:hypothetical protein
MKNNDGIKIDEKTVKIFECSICGAKYYVEELARRCYQAGRIIAHLEAIFIPGIFLRYNESEILGISEIDFSSKSVRTGEQVCSNRSVMLDFVSSNDHMEATAMKELLTARPISIETAVLDYGWRAAYKSIWEQKATPAMKKEYTQALIQKLGSMSQKEREEILIEAIAFKY